MKVERTKLVEADDTFEATEDPYRCIRVGQVTIAAEDPSEIKKLVGWWLEIMRSGKPVTSVAHIGAGTCFLALLLHYSASGVVQTLYEIEPEIERWARKTFPEAKSWKFIEGDYRETLKEEDHQWIVYDVPGREELVRR